MNVAVSCLHTIAIFLICSVLFCNLIAFIVCCRRSNRHIGLKHEDVFCNCYPLEPKLLEILYSLLFNHGIKDLL